MAVPPVVRRTLLRRLAAAAALALAVAGAGAVHERRWLGTDAAASRAIVAAEVRDALAAAAARLEQASHVVEREAARIARAASGNRAELRALFLALEAVHEQLGTPGFALTVFAPDLNAIAWAGRPAVLQPPPFVEGPALLLVENPAGLRLVRIQALADETTRRAALVVAEWPLPLARPAGGVTDAHPFPTSIGAVALRPIVDASETRSAGATAVGVPGAGGPLAIVETSDAALEAARRRWRRRVAAAALATGTAAALLLAAPLLAWRRTARRAREEWAPTAALALLLVAGWVATRAAILVWRSADGGVEAASLWTGPAATPLDLLVSALALGGLVALAASAVERRGRRAQRAARRRGTTPRAWRSFLARHLLAGAAAGALVVSYEWLLRLGLPALHGEPLHFALHPLEPGRLALALGLIGLHAAVLGLAALILRAACLGRGAPHQVRGAAVGAIWVAPGAALGAAAAVRAGTPLVPLLLALAFVAALAWTAGAYRLALARASQAQRLAGFYAALVLPSLVMHPLLADIGARVRRQLVEDTYAPEVANQRRNLQVHLRTALAEIDGIAGLEALAVGPPPAAGPVPADAAFLVWTQTVLAAERLTSSVELYDAEGTLTSRFALNLPVAAAPGAWQEAGCDWELFEEVSPFFAEERRLLHAGRRLCGPNGEQARAGWVEVHVMLDYASLSFVAAQNPYVALLGPDGTGADETHTDLELAVYGWSRRPLYVSGSDAWPLPDDVFARASAAREPFWTVLARAGARYDVYLLNDRGGIYALGYRRPSAFDHLATLAELTVLGGAGYLGLLASAVLFAAAGGQVLASARALLREVRASFYRKLFLAFILAAVGPVLALAVATRAYMAGLLRADAEGEAVRTAAAASRAVEDLATLQPRGLADVPALGDDLVVWVSRVVAQDVNVYDGARLFASSERNLFASGLLSPRTPGDVYRAILLEGRPTYVGRETVGRYTYLLAAAPVRLAERRAVVAVPLALRQREIERQIDELDRRVLLAALAFVLLGAAAGYSMARRVADPLSRLMRATKRIAAGDLDVHVPAASRDELQRLVDAFNSMAADLRRQRADLERTHRLEAWAAMARQVAHDIKNPLTPIQLTAEHLRRVHADRGRPLGDVLDDGVHAILAQVRLLRQIAAEFASLASTPTPRPVPTALGDLVAEVVEPYRTVLAGRIAFDVRLDEPLPPLLVDRTLVGRALTNVIENALHAMPAAGTVAIEASPEEAGGSVRLVVRDTGVGMDEEALGRVFEPYFSTKASGTGLGLTIARRNIEAVGGTIAVTSAPGRGTTVVMTLPVALAAPAATPSPPAG